MSTPKDHPDEHTCAPSSNDGVGGARADADPIETTHPTGVAEARANAEADPPA